MTIKDILLGADPVSALRAAVRTNRLGSIEPSLAALKMPIRPGYHHKDNLDHSIRVLGNAIADETNGPDLILRTAALFHDIGKPATRAFGRGGVVTFTNHEMVGAKMIRPILRKHGYTKDEIASVSLLVALHMRSHGFLESGWTDSAVRRLITDAGTITAMDRLLVLFAADATTKNAQMKQLVRDQVDALAAEIDRIRALDAKRALRPALDGHEVMELLNIGPGKELGKVMRLLNQEQNIGLSRDEATALVLAEFVD